jgi:hypothetical protein
MATELEALRLAVRTTAPRTDSRHRTTAGPASGLRVLLDLRPILLLHNTETESVTAETANVQQYETSVHVSVPWTERPQETMSRIAATFKVAEALVKAMTLLVVALVALGAAVGMRGTRRRRATA